MNERTPPVADLGAQPTLEHLRQLRYQASVLADNFVADLRPFLTKDGLTFRRLPTNQETDEISLTTTCTALMSLALTGKTSSFYTKTNLLKALGKIFAHPEWTSSALPPDNAFTSTIILRSIGTLLKHKEITDSDLKPLRRPPANTTINKLLREKASHLPKNLAVGQYPPSPTIAYWYLDTLDKFSLNLLDNQWLSLARWAKSEFTEQYSLVVSNHESLKDPISMAMAGCLALRLRTMAISKDSGVPESILHELPSRIEIAAATRSLFRLQQRSGDWPKYFPLFHYPDAGANYCFTFELLETALASMATTENNLLEERDLLRGLQGAVSWCREHRLRYSHNGTIYKGWNSGGQIATLKKGMPESWSTAAVHIFLSRLCLFLDNAIKNNLRRRFHARSAEDLPPWEGFIDVDVHIPNFGKYTIKELLDLDIAQPILNNSRNATPIKHRRSALLFGPPGTSKTTLARILARRIGWPYIEINPAHFLSKGLERIYERADEIFEDLLDLSRTVILFDEMDALVQTREGSGGQQLDVTRQFLTTSMLPKLARLHDHAQVIFLMATNHRKHFDPAITRPGRFDLLLCMSPPSWKEKLQHLDRFWPGPDDDKILDCKEVLRSWAKSESSESKTLDRFTFGELKSFFGQLQMKHDSLSRYFLNPDHEQDFRDLVKEWGANLIGLSDRDGKKSYALIEYQEDKQNSRRQ